MSAPSVQAPDLVTEVEIAPIVGLSPKTLANMRSRREGPPYVRVSNRAIRYSRRQVAAWVADRTVTPETRLT
jgi:predicted DNA-binding transcriptional regulator AlpA